jgi:hypothetical protein
MSGLGDAVKGIKQLLLLQEDVRRLDKAGEQQAAALTNLAKDFIALDKRVVRIETIIEMAAPRGPQSPRIEG